MFLFILLFYLIISFYQLPLSYGYIFLFINDGNINIFVILESIITIS